MSTLRVANGNDVLADSVQLQGVRDIVMSYLVKRCLRIFSVVRVIVLFNYHLSRISQQQILPLHIELLTPPGILFVSWDFSFL